MEIFKKIGIVILGLIGIFFGSILFLGALGAALSDSEEPTVAVEDIAEPTETYSDDISQPAFNKDDCVAINYKDYLRNPEQFKGQPVKVTVKVLQVLDKGLFTEEKYYRCISYNESEEYFKENYDEIFIVNDCRSENSEKILENDIIEVYGTFAGTEEVVLALTYTTAEYPAIDMKENVLLEIN